jgi:hypothetical protein
LISQKSSAIGFTGIALLTVSLFSLFLTFPAKAQCGGPGRSASSCKSCHEKQDPIANNGEWHIIHAEKDLCINCHGGNGTTMDITLAHQGMTAHPLSDIYTDCHSCHPKDYDQRAQLFAPTLGVTPGSCATPTAIAAGGVAGEPPAGNLVVPYTSEDGSVQAGPPLLIISGGLLFLVFFCLSLRWLSIHQRT